MSIAVELTDRHRNELRVEVPLDATVGALRNAVNGALPRGYVIEEHDVVPKPFAHYVEDDPECFRGPADRWRLAEVFFDELAAEPLEAVRCRATAPLGPPPPKAMSSGDGGIGGLAEAIAASQKRRAKALANLP